MSPNISFQQDLESYYGNRFPAYAPPKKGGQTDLWSYKGGASGYVGNSYISEVIEVVLDDGTVEGRWTIPYDCRGWWDIAKTIYPVTQEKSADVMRVPKAKCSFTYSDPPFNPCVYTGTNDYLQARWGRRLDDSDRQWLAKHPLSTDAGVPQEYTITAIHQLVAPYGMRVARVRLRTGQLVIGDQVMQWMLALGCNPMAMADRRTSNATAADALGMSLEQANALWRLEFSDEPLPGSVIGEKGYAQAGVATGSFGGHSRYLAPRGRAGDWTVSVQLEPDDRVEYLTTPPDPEYKPRAGVPTLTVSAILGPDDKLIAVKHGGTWRAFSEMVSPSPSVPATTPVAAPSSPPSPVAPTTPAAEPRFTCTLCQYSASVSLRYGTGLDICIDCVEAAWDGLSCPHCHVEYGSTYPDVPEIVGYDTDGVTYQCPKCKEEMLIDWDSTDDNLRPALEVAYECIADDTRYFEDDLLKAGTVACPHCHGVLDDALVMDHDRLICDHCGKQVDEVTDVPQSDR